MIYHTNISIKTNKFNQFSRKQVQMNEKGVWG